MINPSQIDIEAYERDVTAALDRAVATRAAQDNDFKQRMHWFASSGQPIPPQFFLAHADLLTQWIDYIRRQHGPAADWLLQQDRPSVSQRVEAIIDDLSKAIPRYHAMAGQVSASQSALFGATSAANRELDRQRAQENAERNSAHAARSARMKDLL